MAFKFSYVECCDHATNGNGGGVWQRPLPRQAPLFAAQNARQQRLWALAFWPADKRASHKIKDRQNTAGQGGAAQ
jgi:hypothetical protein